MSLETRIQNLLAQAYNTDQWVKDELKGGLILWARYDSRRRVLLAVRTPNGASPTEARLVTRDCGFPVHPPEKVAKSGYRGYKIREKTKDELEAESLAALESNAAALVESERALALSQKHMAGRSMQSRVALESDFVRRAMLEFGFWLVDDVWTGCSGGWSSHMALEKFRSDAARAPKEFLEWVNNKSALQLYQIVF